MVQIRDPSIIRSHRNNVVSCQSAARNQSENERQQQENAPTNHESEHSIYFIFVFVVPLGIIELVKRTLHPDSANFQALLFQAALPMCYLFCAVAFVARDLRFLDGIEDMSVLMYTVNDRPLKLKETRSYVGFGYDPDRQSTQYSVLHSSVSRVCYIFCLF